MIVDIAHRFGAFRLSNKNASKPFQTIDPISAVRLTGLTSLDMTMLFWKQAMLQWFIWPHQGPTKHAYVRPCLCLTDPNEPSKFDNYILCLVCRVRHKRVSHRMGTMTCSYRVFTGLSGPSRMANHWYLGDSSEANLAVIVSGIASRIPTIPSNQPQKTRDRKTTIGESPRP